MSDGWDNRTANAEAFNALSFERVSAAPGTNPMAGVWRRTKWAMLIRLAWWHANVPDAPDMCDVGSPTGYVEFLRRPTGLFTLAADHLDATAAELAVMFWEDIDAESWATMLTHNVAHPWLAAAVPPRYPYPLTWPGRKDTAA
jgi:hypothetical protein